MATSAVRPARNRASLADPRHLMRYLKAQAGLDAKEIGKEEGVSAKTVEESVRLVDGYRKQNTSHELDLAARDLVISSIPKAKVTLHGLLDAMELVEVKDGKDGKTKTVKMQDKTTRMEALKIVNTLISNLQPKGPMVAVNTTQVNQTATISSTETVEERFRRLRAQAAKHNQLPPEVAGVPQYIDAGESAPGLDDDDEDDDDDDEEDDDEE